MKTQGGVDAYDRSVALPPEERAPRYQLEAGRVPEPVWSGSELHYN
jgi:hypothetical protein